MKLDKNFEIKYEDAKREYRKKAEVMNKDFWRSLYQDEYSDEEIVEGLQHNMEALSVGGALPSWDRTDHLHFACDSCYHALSLVDATLSTHRLYLGFYCEKCERTSSRKMSIQGSEPARMLNTYNIFGEREIMAGHPESHDKYIPLHEFEDYLEEQR